MENVTLLGKRLLVTPDAVSDTYDSTIDLVKTDVTKAAEKPQTGTVVKISEECHNPFIRVGDHIHYNQWAGLEVEVDKKKYLILSESEVMMILHRAE